MKQLISFLVVPLIILGILLFADFVPVNSKVTYTFCVALLMATWWITEIVPLAVTSLLPVALFRCLALWMHRMFRPPISMM